jgi:AcrR family transcriptional regulator
MVRRVPTGSSTPQRRRTRAAIVGAAGRLLEAGANPSMADIAAEAEVSRRTVYLHFASLEQLLIDAALGLMSRAALDADIADLQKLHDVEERVVALVRVIQSNALSTEHLGRTIMRLAASPAERPEGDPPRGYRRVAWIEGALEPARERLGAARFEQLVSELTLVLGWEAALVLRDVRGLGIEESVEVSAEAARALVRAALAEV